uniref:Pancreatic trypsin inhibitor n=1 Tax=Rhipicephalus appendiculatus TaxID=34631 RepID=A0A131YHM0_RHIAP
MHKRTLLVILILCNFVPLIAGFKIWSWILGIGRKPTTTLRPTPPSRSNYTRPTCQYGRCFYPLMCYCRIPTTVGYMRYPTQNSPWYYNSTTRTCERSPRAVNACNSFNSRKHCYKECGNAASWLRNNTIIRRYPKRTGA